MFSAFKALPKAERILWILLAIITVVVTVARLGQPKDYNNFLIFQNSFRHLASGLNLYLRYPTEHQDVFKYGPSFAVLMIPWSWLPSTVGALLWNMGGVLMVAAALFQLNLTSVQRQIIMWICLPELIGNLQNFQTNAHLVALFVLIFTCLERKHFLWAGFLLAVTVHTKIFGICFLVMGLMYKDAWKFWAASVFWILLLAVTPLIFVSLENLQLQYRTWFYLLVWDIDTSAGISFMGVFYAFTGIYLNNLLVQLIAGFFLTLPLLLQNTKADLKFKMLSLASLMMWIIIFNHKSESPTYIIGIFGFALAYVLTNWPARRWILAFTLIFISLMYSDATTSSFKNSFVSPYEVKAWPLILVWIGLQSSLLRQSLRARIQKFA